MSIGSGYESSKEREISNLTRKISVGVIHARASWTLKN